VVLLPQIAAFSARNARLAAGVFICALAAVLQGCAGIAPQTAALLDGLPAGLPERVELSAVPFFPQAEYQCGPAALATLLVSSGVKTTPEALVPQVYLPARKGSLQVEMLAAARRHGTVSYQLAPSFVDVMRELAAGTPVILLQNLGFSEGWHYAVAVGYDYKLGMMILRLGVTEREEMPFAVHEAVWKRSGYWAMVAVPPGRRPATADESRWPAAVAAFERAAIGEGNAYHARGELAEAERMLRAALLAAPDSVIVLNNLAQTLSDQGRNAEALPLAERALAAGGPHAAAVRETRDTILKKMKKD
jgi:tetratricopeptide (TPR) repeat protein